MSKFGLKIKNYTSGSVYAVQQGVRTNYDYQEAFLTNSLFLDFMQRNGLTIYKDKATRDIIGISSVYGTRSYEDEITHLEDALAKAPEEKIERIEGLITDCKNNKDKFEKISKEEIREIFYRDGLDIYFDEGKTKIHYKMLYRSAAKAKKGLCMFINEELYDIAHNFLWMGIELPKHNAPIVEIGAYSALVTSTIIDKIQINPDDVLVLKDIDSTFRTNVISVETDEEKHCHAIPRDNYEVVNTIFDGQALIDLSIFPEYGKGFVLLRQHFTKCAAFATDIQGFFKDYFKDDYDTAVVKDMWGNFHKAKDIKLITTNNAIKWIKFGVTYEYWKEWVHENGCMWGVVKTAHESKLGDFQRMSYQMVNTLSEEIISDVMQPSKDYIKALKTDTPTFIDFLRRSSTFSNDYEVLVALYEQDHSFEQCDYFRTRKTEIISNYLRKLKLGKLVQDADNVTIVGSPYAMLLHSVGENIENDVTLRQEKDVIQCYTERYANGEYIAGFRSPHNSANNLLYFHNVHHPYMEKYFKLGTLIIAVNMIHTDIQCRGNGLDTDGDSLYITNKESIVEHVRQAYINRPTIVNNIPQQSKHYDNTPENFALLDNQIASSQLAIGGSSNLAQIAQTYDFTYGGANYKDYVNILAVIAQVAIDSSKRLFDVDINDEISRIKDELNVNEIGFPEFWKLVATSTKKRRELNGNRLEDKINYELHCPMNHVYRLKTESYKPKTETIPIKEFFVKHTLDMNRKPSKRIERLINQFNMDLYNFTIREEEEKNDEEYLLLREDFDDLIAEIQSSVVPSKYVGLYSWLINRAFLVTPSANQNKGSIKSVMNKNKPLLLKVLYDANPEALLKCFSKRMGTPSN